ncbi:MAG: hypothetical protein UX09_C0004G0022 [Candidatus Uhrbacteria bacterium GW2011_GWE2_45_35]|uniref:Uncharacterized protein n=2 Tax=Candidatus Uhriibacteriota TaxID=1752732 RepID=A0A0G1JKX0_9BACT|nr:MAG: hypothetical protein UW63_C0002G0006 [Candidatus Uhrbacteria bacterium GW2011_GWF2_44_350]KKU09102.1 MAG: hypothetical protein UX09_C0004G0022 [Candidatus Uhrbacteria bacterium GW2011_GWE2_45_35]
MSKEKIHQQKDSYNNHRIHFDSKNVTDNFQEQNKSEIIMDIFISL